MLVAKKKTVSKRGEDITVALFDREDPNDGKPRFQCYIGENITIFECHNKTLGLILMDRYIELLKTGK